MRLPATWPTRAAWLTACLAACSTQSGRDPVDAAALRDGSASAAGGAGVGSSTGGDGGTAGDRPILDANPGGDGPAQPLGRVDGSRARDAATDGAGAGALATAPDAARRPEGWTCPEGPFPSLPEAIDADGIDAVPPDDGYFDGGGVLEGPVWIDGALYVSHFPFGELPPSRILRFVPPDDVSVFIADAGTNGLAVDFGGRLVGARFSDGSVTRWSLSTPDSAGEPLAREFQQKRLNSPNDLVLRSDGNIYFTDPSYQAENPPPQTETRLYRISPTGSVLGIDTLNQPNGVMLSLDENTLYVSDPDNVYRYAIGRLGIVTSDGELFSAGGSDGMGLDCAGHLYVTRGNGVVALDASGSEIARIAVDSVGDATNVAFGGPERRTLYITTLGDTQQLFRAELPVPGLPY